MVLCWSGSIQPNRQAQRMRNAFLFAISIRGPTHPPTHTCMPRKEDHKEQHMHMCLQAIPDIGDYTIKKQKRMVGYAPAPDSLLSRAAAEAKGAQVTDAANGLATALGGLATPMGGATSTMSDLTAIGEQLLPACMQGGGG